MKKIILAVVLCLFAVMSVNAQFRLDANIMVPIYNGFRILDTDFSDAADYAYFIPEVDVYYQFDLSLVRLGLGIRMISFFGLLSILTPDIFVEFNLDPVVLRASISGGVAWFVAPIVGISAFSSGPIVVPDVSAAIKFAEFFRVGIGFTMITNLNYPDEYFYSVYGFARFVVVFGGPPKEDTEF